MPTHKVKSHTRAGVKVRAHSRKGKGKTKTLSGEEWESHVKNALPGQKPPGKYSAPRQGLSRKEILQAAGIKKRRK